MQSANRGKTRRVLFAGAGLLVVAALAFSVSNNGLRHSAAPGARQAVPDLRFSTIDGQPWRLGDHRGQVVLVNFWATWCPPCRMETPGLVDLANEYRPKGLAVVGVNMDNGGLDSVREFIRNFRISYPVLIPPSDSPLVSRIDSLPTTLLIDRKGGVATVYNGAVSESAFRRDVDRLLAER